MQTEYEDAAEMFKAIEERRIALVPLDPEELLYFFRGSQEGKTFRMVVPLPGPSRCLDVEYCFQSGCFKLKIVSPVLESIEIGQLFPVLDMAVVETIEPEKEDPEEDWAADDVQGGYLTEDVE